MGGGKRRPKPKTAAAKPAPTATSSRPQHTGPGRVCSICSSDDVFFFAIGRCNHPICSLCAMRMRYKAKDDHCAICKTQLSVMAVFDVNAHEGEVKFSNFGELADDIAIFDGPPLPGCYWDGESKLAYMNCPEHFTIMTSFKRIYCPCVETKCSYEAPSYPALLQHLKSAHKDLTMCLLCLQNRPLFIHEQEVIHKKDLPSHMEGADRSDSKYFSDGAPNKFTAGHPHCVFCGEHFFDQVALYHHLQLTHLTCHLCDHSFMFRYYKGPAELRLHHKQDHFLCQLCDKDASLRDSDVCIAFRGLDELRDHLRGVHAVYDAGRHLVNFGPSRFGGPRRADQVQYFDLDVGSANPFHRDDSTSPPRFENRSRGASNRGRGAHTTTAVSAPPEVPLLPPNMRVAGKVSGSGRLQGADESDFALQAMADAAYRQAAMRNRVSNPSAPPPRTSFPALQEVVRPSEDVVRDKPAEGQAAHPLSLVHQRRSTDKERATRADAVDEAEQRRVARNVVLAEAFGISGVSAELVGGSTVHAAYRQSLMQALDRFHLPKTQLFAPIYPPELLTWARKSHTELCKVERRIQTLLQDPKATSLNLKPMRGGDRAAMHCLARYYRLNSFEYDPDPKRYVSLVKTVESSVPDVLLSDACMSNNIFSPQKLSPATGALPTPVIVLQLAEGLASSWGRPTDRKSGGQPLSFRSALIVFAETVQEVLDVIPSDLTLISLAPSGPSAIALRFPSLPIAQEAEAILRQIAQSLDEHHLLAYFKVHADFVVEREEEQAADRGDMMAEAVAEATGHAVEVREDEAVHAEDAWDYDLVADQEWTHEESTPEVAVERIALRPVAGEDDWEAVVEAEDEWTSFLAERRQGAESTQRYRPAFLVQAQATVSTPPTDTSAENPDQVVEEQQAQVTVAAEAHQEVFDDFSLALALQQEEEARLLYHQDPYLYQPGWERVEASVPAGESWRNVGRPTAATVSSSTPVVAQRGSAQTASSLPTTTAVAVPLAQTIGRANPAPVGPARAPATTTDRPARRGGKFSALLDDDEED